MVTIPWEQLYLHSLVQPPHRAHHGRHTMFHGHHTIEIKHSEHPAPLSIPLNHITWSPYHGFMVIIPWKLNILSIPLNWASRSITPHGRHTMEIKHSEHPAQLSIPLNHTTWSPYHGFMVIIPWKSNILSTTLDYTSWSPYHGNQTFWAPCSVT